MMLFCILILISVLSISAHSTSDNSIGSPISFLSSTPSVSPIRSTYSKSDSDDSRSSRSKSMSGATESASPSDLSATQSEDTGPGRKIAPGNAEYHEKMQPYYNRKTLYHKVTHEYYKADDKEHHMASLHNDEATSSYKKAKKHKAWQNEVKSGKMQPGKKTIKDVPSDGCPSPPCCKGNANCVRKNKFYDWPHKKNSRRLLPVKVSQKRKRRAFESPETERSSSPEPKSSDSSSGTSVKRKKSH